MFNFIKRMYDRGVYDEKVLRAFVKMGRITQEEMDRIINGNMM